MGARNSTRFVGPVHYGRSVTEIENDLLTRMFVKRLDMVATVSRVVVPRAKREAGAPRSMIRARPALPPQL